MSDTENKPPHADAAGNEPAIGDKEDVKVRRDSFSSSSGSTISTVSSNVGDNATRANGSRIPTPSKIPMRRGSSVGTNSGASAAAAAASVASAAQSTPLSTPTKRRPTDSGPTVAPNRLGMAARVTPRVLEKKVVRAGSPNDTLGQRPGLGDSSSGSTRAQSSLELRKAYSASLRNRGMASSSSASTRSRKPLRSLSELQSRHQSLKDLADMEDDRRSSIGSVSSCSSISSAATSASVVSSTPSRSTQRSISSTPGRKTSGIASNSRPSPGRPKSMRKLWPTTVVKEEFTLEEATVQALKEQHFLAEQAIRDLLSEIQQGSSTSTARLEDVSVLRQGLRQLTAHSEVLMQCIEAFEQKTLDQEEYVEASHAEIDRLMGLLTEENALATQMHMPDMEKDIEAMPDALVIRTPDTGESSSSLELDITPAESSDDTEQHREEMLNAMKEDSPLSAYVREILKNATDKIEEKWKARFAEQLAEHEQALAQERERTSASVVTNSRMATETMQSKDDEIKALREENSAILAQKKHIEIELDFAKQELEFMKQQLDEQDDERSSNAHSFWQKTTDLAKKNRTLTEELAVANQTVNRLNETIKIMKSKATDAKADNLDRIRKTREMESEKNLLYDNLASMEAKFEDEKARREQFQVNVEQLTVENTALYAQMVALQTTHEAKMEELRQLYEKRNGVLAGEMKLLQTQNRLMRSAEPTGESSRGNSGASRFSREEEGEMSDRLKEMTDELLDTRQELSEKIEIISELERRVADGEILRRKLHNTIQELRGNVRVHVRLRPFLRSDGEENVHGEPPQPSLRCDTFGSTISTNVEKPHTFAFDKIYGQSDSQETVFDDVAEFVQSAMDGYNVCIFAYGQTGSGKTHTMQGSGKAQMRGIIPRSIEHIINTCEQLSSMGWTYALDVNFFEIYNETIRDLLATDNRREQRKYNIRTDKRGKNYVEGLTEIAIDFENAHEQIEDIVNLAACNRSVDRTDMNAHSSRSHSIFTMKIRGFNEAQNTEMEGSLSLVDLAGSERLSRSNATGDRLKEAQAINKSLSSLADVFQALVKKSNHVPYRNSKLTYVLQPALSGDGKTLMMVNLSPTFMSLDESLCSLRFAQNVSQCELGAPVRQIKARSSFYGKEALAANSGPQSSPAKTGAPPRRSSLTPSTFSSLSARKFP